MTPPHWTKRLKDALGIDPAVAFVLGGNVGIALSSLLQLVLMLRYMTADQRGLMFNFTAFFYLQILFDFGFSLVVQQLASHQRAFLHETKARTLAGETAAHSRLASILRLALRWNVAIFALWAAAVLPTGWLFFRSVQGLEGIDWRFAWVLTVVGSGGCLVATVFIKFLSGCGDVLAVARVTTLQVLVSSLGFCAVVAAGGGLLSYPVSLFCGLAVPAVWLLFLRRPLLAGLLRTPADAGAVGWRREVLPFQWRIAVSMLCTQTFQLMNQVTMASFGPAAAGQLGLVMTILLAIQALGLAWLETRVPVFGNLIARKRWFDLDGTYRHVLWKSSAFVGGILSLFVLIVVGLNLPGAPAVAPWRDAFLSPLPTALMALIILANHVFFVRAAYLRAHCREPYLFVNLAMAAAQCATVVLAGRYGTLPAMVGGYLFWTVAIGQGWGFWVFDAKRRDWHQASA